MVYFLTGATGFIGRRLAQRLVREGHEVRALVRSPVQDLAEEGVTLFAGDITDKESLRAPMTGAGGVFHLAAWYRLGSRGAEVAERVNVAGTRNVLETMRDLGVPKGVYTSTLAVFSDTKRKLVDESYRHDPADGFLSEYDRTKWLAHYRVADPMMRAGLPLVIVQPGVVYGPGDGSAIGALWRQYLKKQLFVAPKGTAFSWGYVDDIVTGHLLAMERGEPGESYIIGGPVHTLEEALRVAERVTGIPGPRVYLSPGAMRRAAGVVGVFENFLPLPENYTAEGLRAGAGVTYIGSNQKARDELGYSPRSLEEGLKETLEVEAARLGRA